MSKKHDVSPTFSCFPVRPSVFMTNVLLLKMDTHVSFADTFSMNSVLSCRSIFIII